MWKKNIIVNFTIQKLKNKHISLKKYTNWAILGHVTQNLEFTSWTTSCEPKSPTNAKIPHLHVHKPKNVVVETVLVIFM